MGLKSTSSSGELLGDVFSSSSSPGFDAIIEPIHSVQSGALRASVGKGSRYMNTSRPSNMGDLAVFSNISIPPLPNTLPGGVVLGDLCSNPLFSSLLQHLPMLFAALFSKTMSQMP